MKQKPNNKSQKTHLFSGLSKVMMLVAAVFLVVAAIVPTVAADRAAEMRRLEAENSTKRSIVQELAARASDYQSAISVLSSQISSLQAQIDVNQAEQNRLQREIDAAQAELNRQRGVLGADIKAMYVDGEPSTIEILAASKNLSEFVDKETYRNTVQKKIQDTMKKIEKLQAELQAKKSQVEELLTAQRAQRAQLDAGRAEQTRLLSLNKSEQAGFNAEIKANNDRLNQLRREEELERCGSGGCSGGILGGGGYPWGYAKCIHTGRVEGSCWNYDWGESGSAYRYSGAYAGGWGYRNCTDWVAWRSSGRVPSAGTIGAYSGANGNAKWWDDAARSMGRRVSTTPHNGDTAVREGAEFGHVLYVEETHDDGSVTFSDYNRAGTGKYSIDRFSKVGDGRYRAPNGVIYDLEFVTW